KNPEKSYGRVGDEPKKWLRWFGGLGGVLVGFYGRRKEYQAILTFFVGVSLRILALSGVLGEES
ncbi:MAG: hypothetical protein Q8830_03375, partial [Candidatus Phytoplasma australasiaticum]|nr:hypothetical protein [Candidatus Phytoplasma australasiaticum]